MDALTHTILAVGSLFGCFLLGGYLTKKELFEQVVTTTLDRLERDGYIFTNTDKDGEKELVSITEIRAQAFRDAYSAKVK